MQRYDQGYCANITAGRQTPLVHSLRAIAQNSGHSLSTQNNPVYRMQQTPGKGIGDAQLQQMMALVTINQQQSTQQFQQRQQQQHVPRQTQLHHARPQQSTNRIHLAPINLVQSCSTSAPPATKKNLFAVLMKHRSKATPLAKPSFVREEETEIYQRFLARLQSEHHLRDSQFCSMISHCSRQQQFLFTQQRWAQQMKEARHVTKRCGFLFGQIGREPAQTIRDRLSLPIGSYVVSPNSNRHYMIVANKAKTLQGFIYSGCVFDESFIDLAVNFAAPLPEIVTRSMANPRLAIKFYDKDSCDRGVSLCGRRVMESAVDEMALTQSIYSKAVSDPNLSRPLFPWLPAPSKNLIHCIEHWETEKHDAYFMVMEYANCGELLEVIDDLHQMMNTEKKYLIEKIEEINDHHRRAANIDAYRQSMKLKAVGQSPYIELVRFMFQQMVQAVATLHNQGVAHMDVGLENFVVHFDQNGQFLVKLIDFGRAMRMKKREGGNLTAGRYQYEAFDFSVSTFPGKLRYMSPEAALFLKYQDADPYDASKEDIYALGVVLVVMLTGAMPWDSPLYVERDGKNRSIGYLNGSKKMVIDLETMKDVRTGQRIDPRYIDMNFEQFQTAQGVHQNLLANCHIDYFSEDALDLICQIFEHRLSLGELLQHRFVSTPPNPVMAQGIHRYAAMKREEKQADLQSVGRTIQNMVGMDNQWLNMKAALMTVEQRRGRSNGHHPHLSTRSTSPISDHDVTTIEFQSIGSSMTSSALVSDDIEYLSPTPRPS